MSPKFYFTLWVVFGAAVGVMSLAGAFTMFTAVVFGFIAFGLTFTGMMCVLPSVVSHPAVLRIKAPARTMTSASRAPAAAKAFTYRSA